MRLSKLSRLQAALLDAELELLAEELRGRICKLGCSIPG